MQTERDRSGGAPCCWRSARRGTGSRGEPVSGKPFSRSAGRDSFRQEGLRGTDLERQMDYASQAVEDAGSLLSNPERVARQNNVDFSNLSLQSNEQAGRSGTPHPLPESLR
jgi:hypothetical protein